MCRILKWAKFERELTLSCYQFILITLKFILVLPYTNQKDLLFALNGSVGIIKAEANLIDNWFTSKMGDGENSLKFASKQEDRKEKGSRRKHERHYVQHNYHDYSRIVTDPEDEGTIKLVSRTPAKGGVSVPFPFKLHDMLESVIDEGLGHIVSWQPHGRAFAVHNAQEFVRDVMPLYFRQSKLTSFQRQLNLYGFCRLTTGPDAGAYYHELFLRGKAFLCKKMRRTKIKGTRSKAASSPDTEPDFYKMPRFDFAACSKPDITDESVTEELLLQDSRRTSENISSETRYLCSSPSRYMDRKIRNACIVTPASTRYSRVAANELDEFSPLPVIQLDPRSSVVQWNRSKFQSVSENLRLPYEWHTPQEPRQSNQRSCTPPEFSWGDIAYPAIPSRVDDWHGNYMQKRQKQIEFVEPYSIVPIQHSSCEQHEMRDSSDELFDIFSKNVLDDNLLNECVDFDSLLETIIED